MAEIKVQKLGGIKISLQDKSTLYTLCSELDWAIPHLNDLLNTGEGINTSNFATHALYAIYTELYFEIIQGVKSVKLTRAEALIMVGMGLKLRVPSPIFQAFIGEIHQKLSI